jgi:hypothetical protein
MFDHMILEQLLKNQLIVFGNCEKKNGASRTAGPFQIVVVL